ncbi:hypothetical protein MXB_5074 [Myxobolus squamalis]|nr:hypothetical protein MXB_5074 [Myxobolus squamalis]
MWIIRSDFEQENMDKYSVYQLAYCGKIPSEYRRKIKMWPILLECENLINNNELECIYRGKLLLCKARLERSQSNYVLNNNELDLFLKQQILIDKDVDRCDKSMPYYKNVNNLNKLRDILLVFTQ